MKHTILLILGILALFQAEAKTKEKHIRFINRLSNNFYVTEVVHTEQYTLLECVYDETFHYKAKKKKSQSSSNNRLMIDDKMYLEDFHTGERYELLHTKNVKKETLLTGRKSFKLYFPPLIGKVRDANLCLGDETVLMKGMTIDRRADLRYYPAPTEYGTVNYCDIQGHYIAYPNYKYQHNSDLENDFHIERIEMIGKEIIFTIGFGKRSSVRFNEHYVRSRNNTYIESFEIVWKHWGTTQRYSTSSYCIDTGSYIQNAKTKKKFPLKVVEGIDYNEVKLIKESGKGSFKVVFDFDGNTISPYNLVLKSKNTDITFEEIELSHKE